MAEKQETTYLSLHVALTDERRMELSSELAGTIVELEELMGQKRDAMSIYKDREKAIKAKLSELSIDLKDGHTLETVRCARVWNYRNGTITTYRGDTGEVVEQRDMDNHERQIKFNLDNDDDVPTLPDVDQPISLASKRKAKSRAMNPGITREKGVDLSDYRDQ